MLSSRDILDKGSGGITLLPHIGENLITFHPVALASSHLTPAPPRPSSRYVHHVVPSPYTASQLVWESNHRGSLVPFCLRHGKDPAGGTDDTHLSSRHGLKNPSYLLGTLCARRLLVADCLGTLVSLRAANMLAVGEKIFVRRKFLDTSFPVKTYLSI